MAMKKDRTIYDLKAWEIDAWGMTTTEPQVAMCVTNKGKVVTIKLCAEIYFMPCDLASDSKDFYHITSFEFWLAGFNKHHGTECKNMRDIRDFYRKGGALHW